MKELIIICRLMKLSNGRAYCRIHKQALLYKFGDKLICSCGENELIVQYGLKTYLDFMNNKGVKNGFKRN